MKPAPSSLPESSLSQAFELVHITERLLGIGISIYTLARFCQMDWEKLRTLAMTSPSCVAFMGHPILLVVALSRFRINREWPAHIFADFIEQHSPADCDNAKALANLLRVRWAAELLKSSNV